MHIDIDYPQQLDDPIELSRHRRLRRPRRPIRRRPRRPTQRRHATLTSAAGQRNPYDESRVQFDCVYPVVAEWYRTLAVNHCMVIVSGRHTSCGSETIDWLLKHNLKFDHIYMRNAGDNRPDAVIKMEILQWMLSIMPKEQIVFVVDDRPRMVRAWREAGLKVYPVRGMDTHSPHCRWAAFKDLASSSKDKTREQDDCPDCGALIDF